MIDVMRVICIKNLEMEKIPTIFCRFYEGRYYLVKYRNGNIFVKDGDGEITIFTNENFNEFFKTTQQIRDEKLENLGI